MKRVAGITGAAVFLMVTMVALSPFALRHLDFFRVRQIEIVGLQYLSADQVVDSLHLEPNRTIFHSIRTLADRAAKIPGITDARVERRLPGTLRLILTERAPVAFAVGDSGVVPLDAEGRPVPYDPLRAKLDLPLIRGADSLLVRALAMARAADPLLFDATEAAVRQGDSTVVLSLDGQQVLFEGVPTTEQLAAVASVRERVTDEGRPVTVIDARFEGMVIVRMDLS